jgi:uncharacterized protein (TIGR00730 family)
VSAAAPAARRVTDRRITVFGGSRVPPDSPEYAAARRFGRTLAERGFVLVTGGYNGVMEAVSRGAREGGGQAVGVTVQVIGDAAAPNAYLSEEIQTAALLERIDKLVELGAGYVVLPGSAGTLCELAVVWNLAILRALQDKPIVVVGDGWRQVLETMVARLHTLPADLGHLTFAADADAAAEAITARLLPG